MSIFKAPQNSVFAAKANEHSYISGSSSPWLPEGGNIQLTTPLLPEKSLSQDRDDPLLLLFTCSFLQCSTALLSGCPVQWWCSCQYKRKWYQYSLRYENPKREGQSILSESHQTPNMCESRKRKCNWDSSFKKNKHFPKNIHSQQIWGKIHCCTW